MVQSIAARIAVPGHRREAKNAVIGTASKLCSPTPLSSRPARSISHGLPVWKITVLLPHCFNLTFYNYPSCFPLPMENNPRRCHHSQWGPSHSGQSPWITTNTPTHCCTILFSFRCRYYLRGRIINLVVLSSGPVEKLSLINHTERYFTLCNSLRRKSGAASSEST